MAAPPSPDSLDIIAAKRVSVAPAQRAAFPKRECPCKMICLLSISGNFSKKSTVLCRPQAQAPLADHSSEVSPNSVANKVLTPFLYPSGKSSSKSPQATVILPYPASTTFSNCHLDAQAPLFTGAPAWYLMTPFSSQTVYFVNTDMSVSGLHV